MKDNPSTQHTANQSAAPAQEARINTRALHSITYGLYIVGAAKDGKLNAQIANTVIQVASQPPSLSVCINKDNLTYQYIKDSGAFSVSVLSQDAPLPFIGRFGFKSGRDTDKFDGINYKVGETGSPIVLDHALAYLEVKVTQEVDAGTHADFIGDLVSADVLQDGEPMTYAYYHLIKRGTTPKTAPSYVEERREKVAKVASYECNVCGYIYDPEVGDPDSGIAAGTAFEDLPGDWVCPVCGATKDEFTRLE